MSNKLFILFGATGSLAKNKVFPALSKIFTNNKIEVIACGRKSFNADYFRDYLRGLGLNEEFVNHVKYVRGGLPNFTQLDNEINLTKPDSIYCYLSLPPVLYLPTINFIFRSFDHDKIHIALEKPFGTSLSSAKKLAKKINKLGRNKFYIVDHYLAKEAIISHPEIILDNVNKIEMSIFEEEGVGGREVFYDQIGVTLDTVQNHILNTLSKLAPGVLDDLKYKHDSLIVGQYDGYGSLPGVSFGSKTETYIKAEFEYKNIKVVTRSGKAMSETNAVVSIDYNNGKNENILIKPNPKEIVTPHEHIINDFLGDKRRFEVQIADTLLAWKIIDPVLKEKASAKMASYPKGLDWKEIEMAI